MASERVSVQFQAWVDGQWKKISRVWLPVEMVPPVGDQIIITRTVTRGTGPGGRDSADFQYVVKERVWSLSSSPHYGVIIVVEEATQ